MMMEQVIFKKYHYLSYFSQFISGFQNTMKTILRTMTATMTSWQPPQSLTLLVCLFLQTISYDYFLNFAGFGIIAHVYRVWNRGSEIDQHVDGNFKETAPTKILYSKEHSRAFRCQRETGAADDC